MAELVGNLLIAQSGGPTVVMNASLAGIVQEAGKHEQIEEIYGALHGMTGILDEDLIDLNEEKNKTLDGLRHAPGAALGTCRYRFDFVGKAEEAEKDMQRLFEVVAAHQIRYLLYVGGSGSVETASQIHDRAKERNYDLRVIAVPKTIDNDLAHTDHCPGYGSVVKYNATTVMEIAADLASVRTPAGTCCVIEVMGRKTGWIAAGTVLCKRSPSDAPHLILVPEIPFDPDTFLAKVRQIVTQLGSCVVVVAEGLRNREGTEIAADKTQVDAYGHFLLSGAAQQLATLIRDKLQIRSRCVRLGYAQRAAAHAASATDIAEAVACGEAAVRAAVGGQSGVMVQLTRAQQSPYQFSTGLQSLKDVLNAVHALPRDWLTEDGFLPNEKFIEFARPLIEGEVVIPFENGLPKYAALEKHAVEKKLPARNAAAAPPAAAS